MGTADGFAAEDSKSQKRRLKIAFAYLKGLDVWRTGQTYKIFGVTICIDLSEKAHRCWR